MTPAIAPRLEAFGALVASVPRGSTPCRNDCSGTYNFSPTQIEVYGRD
ncbi:MAG: hypothetical protein ACJARS_000069 [bacterium]|jgi:hypothetical protein